MLTCVYPVNDAMHAFFVQVGAKLLARARNPRARRLQCLQPAPTREAMAAQWAGDAAGLQAEVC